MAQKKAKGLHFIYTTLGAYVNLLFRLNVITKTIEFVPCFSLQFFLVKPNCAVSHLRLAIQAYNLVI